MEIQGSRDGLFVLTPLAPFTSPGIALSCACTIAAHRFSGATKPDEPGVSIEIRTLHAFVEALRVLVRDRSGEAILACPQLRLTLTVVDRAGHVQLSATLSEFHVERHYEGMHQVMVGFEIYPTDLPQILQDFENLLASLELRHSSGEGSEA